MDERVSVKSLTFRRPPADEARRMASVSWRAGQPFIGEKRLVLEEEDPVDFIRKAYKEVPVSIGYLRFFSYLRQRYVNIRRDDVQKFLANQEARQIYRRPRIPVKSGALVSKKPGVIWTVDIKKLPETYHRGRKYVGICVWVDNHSKYVAAYPMSDMTPRETARCFQLLRDELQEVLGTQDLPWRTVKTDNGSEFRVEFSQALEAAGIKQVRGAPRTPTAQAAAERANQTLGGYIVATARERYGSARRWVEIVPKVTALINSTYNRITRIPPIEVLKGTDTAGVNERIIRESKKRKWTSLYDDEVLHEGDHVRLSMRVAGPSVVKDAIKNNLRKVGSEEQWTRDVYQVTKRVSRQRYKVSNGLIYDRADLLLIPGPDAEPTQRARGRARIEEEYADPRLQPLPERERRAPQRLVEEPAPRAAPDRPVRAGRVPERFRG